MRPEHLPLLTTVSAPTVAPDGSYAVIATSRPSFVADAYVGQLWRVPLGGGEPVRMTRGFADSSPQVSPDGRLVAFLRREPGGRAQLFVAPASGGEAAQATDQKLGVGAFCWSPDSTRLAFTARVAAEGRYGTLEGVDAGQEDPRHLTGYQVQANGLGWSTDRPAQLFVVHAPDPFGEPGVKPIGRSARDRKAAAADVGHVGVGADAPDMPWNVPVAHRLTDGAWDVREPVFAPAGDAVLVTTRTDADADEHLRTAIHRVCVETGRTTPVVADPALSFAGACPVGEAWLFLLGTDLGEDGRDFVATNAAVYVVARDGGAPVRLTDPETVELAGPLVPAGPDAVLAVRPHRGTSEVLRVAADGTVDTRWSGQPTAEAVAALPDGGVVASVVPVDSAGELLLVQDGAPRLLTDFGAALREATTVVTPRELSASAPDGTSVHGWVLVPDGEGPHPVLLNIHGGPYAHYTGDFFDEFQVYVEAGYAVVACNPRGSGSYGQAHGAAIRHDFGNLDTVDVLAFLDHATATVPGLDAGRVGIMGGSYGGYLTAWIIAHDHRFAGAIVERGFLDPASFLGASDIGWFFMPAYNGTDAADQDRQSPTLLAHQVRTPTFVVHSELDLRCPLGQALRYFTALKAAGVEAELLVFPGENHELSRSGTPWHRRQRFEAILDWWGRHLPVHEPGRAG